MRMFWIAAAVTVTLFASANQASNAKTKAVVPGLQPFECSNTESMNVAKFVSPGDGTEPLFLKTVLHGTTCGYEGGQFTNIEGLQFSSVMFEIAGTNNTTGFGPYISIIYNGNNVSTLPLSTAHLVHNYGVMGILRQWLASDFNLPPNAQISSIQIIANPTAAQDGSCMIRQIHLNGGLNTTAVKKTNKVINACP